MREMYNDVKCAISNNRPQLAIIALFAYSEMIGGIWRIVHGEEENVVFGKGQSNKNFASYISMSGKKYSGINSREIYRIIRGGLVHRYLIREAATVKINPDDPMNRNPGVHSQAIIFRGSKIEFDINAYFLDLRRSVTELRRDIIRKNLQMLHLQKISVSQTIWCLAKEGQNQVIEHLSCAFSSSGEVLARVIYFPNISAGKQS
jgi:hypothetical protein